jgi:photosystem II stability/assembly factor-like uncharacterized protein
LWASPPFGGDPGEGALLGSCEMSREWEILRPREILLGIALMLSAGLLSVSLAFAGVEGVDVSAFAADRANPGTIYAGTSGSGVFKSADGGRRWRPVQLCAAPNIACGGSVFVRALAVDPETPAIVYAATAAGLFRTTDGGESWRAAPAGLPSDVRAFAIDPQTPTTVYAGTYFGVFKTTDGGRSWTKASAGLLGRSIVKALAIDPHTPTTVYAGTYARGVFMSTNGGGTWRAVDTGLVTKNVEALAIDPQAPTTVYAGTLFGGVFKSTGRGSTWRAVTPGLRSKTVGELAIDPQKPTTVYAGTGDHDAYDRGVGVVKSTDGGRRWRAMNAGLGPKIVSALTIDATRSATVYAGTQQHGVFKSTDGGRRWRAVNTGLAPHAVMAIASSR